MVADWRLAPSRHPWGRASPVAYAQHHCLLRVLVGFPASDRAGAVGNSPVMPWQAAAAARSRLTSPHSSMPMDPKEPTFAERTATLKETAVALARAADIVLAEVQHMEAAQERFAARKAKPRRS